MVEGSRKRRRTAHNAARGNASKRTRQEEGEEPLTITPINGETRALELKQISSLPSAEGSRTLLSAGQTSLLVKPVKELRQELVADRRRELHALQAKMDHDEKMREAGEQVEETHQELWVDKYAPKKFLELISESRATREILGWIKQWDDCVKNGIRGKDTRPEKRVLLLVGPPGMGKTTLAHVLAAHCKYNPVEINASDDRTAKKFDAKLRAALEMRSVFGDQRPNLVIVDEIDGLSPGEGKGAADALLRWVDDAPQAKKGKAKRRLMRPIICICNDQYAPALRKLRAVALVFKIEKPKTGRLATRLGEICAAEGLQADPSSLTALCELADNDIRSCLNTLQFIRKKTTVLSASALSTSLVGHKDVAKSMFKIWEAIFLTDSSAAMRAMLGAKAGAWSSSKPKTQADDGDLAPHLRLYSSIMSLNETGRLIEGVRENLGQVKYVDPDLTKTVQVLDWLAWGMDLTAGAVELGSFSMMAYAPFALVLAHYRVSQPHVPRLAYPRAEYELRTARGQMENIVASFLLDLQPSVRQFLGASAVVRDVAPLLLPLLAPPIRPVNFSLFSKEETKMLMDLVATMVTYRLSYAFQVTFDNNTGVRVESYQLSPPIDKLCEFAGLERENAVRELTHTQKQVLNSKLESERLKSGERNAALQADEEAEAAPQARARKRLSMAEAAAAKKKKELEESAREQEAKLKRIAAKATNASTPVARDFFGRVIKSKAQTGPGGAAKSSKFAKHPVFYRFNEGFTNAVRRKVYVGDFL